METDPLAPRHFDPGDRQSCSSPRVSIVIVSNDPEDELESRIALFRSRYDAARPEYVLVWAGSGRTSTSGDLKRRFPQLRVLSAPPGTSLAELRTQGIRAAAGDIVMLLQHDSSVDMNLADVAIVERKADARERSGSAKWGVALGSAKERPAVVPS